MNGPAWKFFGAHPAIHGKVVLAATKGEARAVLKAELKMRRLPKGVTASRYFPITKGLPSYADKDGGCLVPQSFHKDIMEQRGSAVSMKDYESVVVVGKKGLDYPGS